jgi:tetratricopeptide (TPR) repeat protein
MAARARRRPPLAASPAHPPLAKPRDAWQWAAPLVVGAAAFLAYANSLGNGFVWDDYIILTRQLVVFRTAGDVLAPPRDIPQFSPDYYRPLTIATYLFDRVTGGDRPFAFHLTVVLAHSATSVLVYLFALQLLAVARGDSRPRPGAREGALTAGALFALHPVHTESVAWAAGRADVLATGFVLAALLVHGRARASWADTALAGLCTLAALGAKETAVAIYPLLLLRDLLLPPVRRTHVADWVRACAGPIAGGALYVLLRANALGEVVGSAPGALPAGQRTALELAGAVGTYAGKLLWPADLNAYIDHIPTGPLTVALALLLVAGLAAALWRWWRVPADAVPLFGIAWLTITLLPSLAILWKIPDAPLAERYLYLPSVGFCLLAGDLAARLWAASRQRRVLLAAALAIVLLAAGAATARRNPVWHDDIALWEDTEQRSRVSGMAARGLGTAYQQAGRAAEARAAFERALSRRNTPSGLLTIHNNLGTLAMHDGDYPAAQRAYEAALAANPSSADTLFNLGLAVLQGGGQSREAAGAALAYYERAQRLNPHDSDIEAAMAQAYAILGDRPAAQLHARRALELGARGPTADSLRALLQ